MLNPITQWQAQALSPTHVIIIEDLNGKPGRVIADNALPESATLLAAAPSLAQSLQDLVASLKEADLSPATAMAQMNARNTLTSLGIAH